MSIYLLAKKLKEKMKHKETVSPFYLNMTHTGRVISKCNTNKPTLHHKSVMVNTLERNYNL